MQYPIRQMNVGEVLDQAIKLMKNRFKTLLMIATMLYLPYLVVAAFLGYAGGSMSDPGAYGEMPTMNVTGLIVGFVVFILFLTVLMPLSTASAVMVLSEEYLGNTISARQAIGRSMPVLMRLIGTNILSSIVIMLGMLALILPGIYFMLRYLLTSQVVVVEGLGGSPALKRSWHLMKDNLGNGFTLVFIIAIITWAFQFVGLLTGSELLSILINLVSQMVLFVFGLAAWVVLYFSARARHDNFDLQVLAEQLGRVEPSAGAPEAF